MQTNALSYSNSPKMEIHLLKNLETKEDLSLAYTPGIAQVCELIQKEPEAMFTHTFRRNNLAVISDGTAVLGLGNIGHKAAFPVMEGKAMLFKKFGNIDAIPLVISAQNDDELIRTIENISDSFAAINLEDIAAPRCFAIEKALKERLQIPVMHDDQHGTAVVVLAAVQNALALFEHQGKQTKVIVNGAGAAGLSIVHMLHISGFDHILMVDSKGIIHKNRTDLTSEKQAILEDTNPQNIEGSLFDALEDAGVFIGVSKGNILHHSDIKRMQKDSIVIAMANPIPEIMPDIAKGAGAAVVATGRSDLPNQVNNALGFPGIFRAAIDTRSKITEKMLLAASLAIVEYHQKSLMPDMLLPSILDIGVHEHIALRVKQATT